MFVKQLLWELHESNSEIRIFIDQNVEAFNGQPGKPKSFDLLDKLLLEQYYRLSFWKVGAEELNYRRFFTVNELICMKVDIPEVFDQTHALIAELVNEKKKLTGCGLTILMVSTIRWYIYSACKKKTNGVYVVIEKILDLNEQENLPLHWPIQGTSGYEFFKLCKWCFFISRLTKSSLREFTNSLAASAMAMTGWFGRKNS